MMRWSLSLLLALSAGFTNLAAQQAPTARLQGDHFIENVRSEAPVSGGDIVGVVVESSRPPKGAQKLYVRRPSIDNPLVCIEAATIDGSYIASNTYMLPPAAPGTYVQIPIDSSRPLGTSHLDLFRSAVVQTFAILARTGVCAGHSTDLIPLSWGEPPLSNSALKITIAVLSGRTSASILMIDNGSEKPQACDPIDEGRRTAFDALCSLTLPSTQSGFISIRLQRCAFDDCTKSPSVRLAM